MKDSEEPCGQRYIKSLTSSQKSLQLTLNRVSFLCKVEFGLSAHARYKIWYGGMHSSAFSAVHNENNSLTAT